MLHSLMRWKNWHAGIFFSNCFFLYLRCNLVVSLKFLMLFIFSYHYGLIIVIFSSCTLRISLSVDRSTGSRPFVNFWYTYGSLKSLLKIEPFHLKKSINSIIIAANWSFVAIRQLFLIDWLMFGSVFFNDLLFELHFLVMNLGVS